MINKLSSAPSARPAKKRRPSVIGTEIGNFLTDITNLLGAVADPLDLVQKPDGKRLW